MTVRELQEVLALQDQDAPVRFEYTTRSCFYMTEEVSAARTQSDSVVLLGNYIVKKKD